MKRVSHEILLLIIVALSFTWSAVEPADRFTWSLEVFPGVAGIIAVVVFRRRFPLSLLALWLIALHCVILFVGGHYTYAEVPLFNWLRDAVGFSRNHYDRLGHFAQGFVPAVIVREVLLRRTALTPGKLLFFLVVCVCLAISASYELFEALVSLTTSAFTGEGAVAFLGMQGDPWDTQTDMAFALIGAVTLQLTLSGRLDRSIKELCRKEEMLKTIGASRS